MFGSIKLLTLVILSCGLLTACEHTVQGFGQDVQNTGKAISKSVS